jgi:hypothetical protein
LPSRALYLPSEGLLAIVLRIVGGYSAPADISNLTAPPRDLGNDGYECFMFYHISKAIWPMVAPTSALILITAAATIGGVLRVSKWAT